ncbi:hypothetical protein [Dendronalium phyllosphericum]
MRSLSQKLRSLSQNAILLIHFGVFRKQTAVCLLKSCDRKLILVYSASK